MHVYAGVQIDAIAVILYLVMLFWAGGTFVWILYTESTGTVPTPATASGWLDEISGPDALRIKALLARTTAQRCARQSASQFSADEWGWDTPMVLVNTSSVAQWSALASWDKDSFLAKHGRKKMAARDVSSAVQAQFGHADVVPSAMNSAQVQMPQEHTVTTNCETTLPGVVLCVHLAPAAPCPFLSGASTGVVFGTVATTGQGTLR